MGTTSKKRKGGGEVSLPQHFVPKFWQGQDNRVAVVKEIRRRVRTLQQDVGADSYQKEILCERAIFMLCQLETMECDAITHESLLDPGVYTQMVNALSGLLNKLGLERAVAKSNGLKAYLAEKGA